MTTETHTPSSRNSLRALIFDFLGFLPFHNVTESLACSLCTPTSLRNLPGVATFPPPPGLVALCLEVGSGSFVLFAEIPPFLHQKLQLYWIPNHQTLHPVPFITMAICQLGLTSHWLKILGPRLILFNPIYIIILGIHWSKQQSILSDSGHPSLHSSFLPRCCYHFQTISLSWIPFLSSLSTSTLPSSLISALPFLPTLWSFWDLVV